jgi:hypothetical protein
MVGITEYSDSQQSASTITGGQYGGADVPIVNPDPNAGAEKSTDKSVKYEAYLMVDVIGGEVNSRTMANIVCRYRGETLGDMYIRLFRKKYAHDNDWELTHDRPREFIDATPWLKESSKPEPMKVKTGGKQTIRNYGISRKKNTRKTIYKRF